MVRIRSRPFGAAGAVSLETTLFLLTWLPLVVNETRGSALIDVCDDSPPTPGAPHRHLLSELHPVQLTLLRPCHLHRTSAPWGAPERSESKHQIVFVILLTLSPVVQGLSTGGIMGAAQAASSASDLMSAAAPAMHDLQASKVPISLLSFLI